MSVLGWLRERFKRTLPTPTNIRRSFDVARQFPQQYRERVVQPIQRAPQQVQRFVQPAPRVRPQDVIRELPRAFGEVTVKKPIKFAGEAARFLVRNPISLMSRQTFTPETRTEKFLLGKEPIIPAEKSWGAQKTGIPLVGVGLTALGTAVDLTGWGAGKSQILKGITKTKNIGKISNLLKATGKIDEKAIPTIARKLVNVSDVNKVKRAVEETAKSFPKIVQGAGKVVTPKVVKPEIPKNVAIRTMRSGKRVPAIRQKSGIFAEKEFETHPFNEKNIGGTDNIQSLASTLDDIPQHELSQKGFGPMMKLYNKISTMAKDRIQFVNTYKQRIGQAFSRNRLGRKDMDIVEQILDGKKPAGATELHNQTANEIRVILDELRVKANVTRRLMGKEEIGYIQEYSPRIKETSVWQDIIQSKDTTISEVMDFIVPNQKMNPHAKQRVLQAMQGRKVNLMEALDRYTDAIGNDVFLTPQIEKIKAVKSVLEGRGFLKTSAWLNDFIRHNLIGKPAKAITRLDLTGRTAQKVMGKITHARNLGALAFNLTWMAFTQPMSMLMTISRSKLGNTLKGGLDWFTNPKLAREIMKTPTMVRKTSKGIGTTLGGDIDRKAVALYKGPLDKVNDVLGAISNAIEKHVTGASIAAGLRRANQLGIKGKDKQIYGQYIGEVTQSMYDRIGRPLTLNAMETRMLFPFQTFAHEAFRYARTLAGKGGGIPVKVRERFGQAISLVVGTYLYNQYTDKVIGRKKGSVGSFIPFAGSYVDEQIEKVGRIGKEALDIEDKSIVGQATGRAPIAPMQDIEKAFRAVYTFAKTGSWDNLRKQLVFWGMGLTGVGGATQVNRAIDALIAIEKGYSESASGRVRFPIEGGLEKAKAIIGGPYITKKGKEYIKGDVSLLGEKESEIYKVGGKSFEQFQTEKQASEELKALKPTEEKQGFLKSLFKKEPEAQEIAPGIYGPLSDGKFYVKDEDKTLDNEYKVRQYLFEKEYGNEELNKKQYKLDYERAKRDDDLNKYMELSQARFDYLEQYKQLLDPNDLADKKKLIDIANEQGDLLYYMNKYAGYGGFTKGGGGGGASITKQLSALNTDYKSNVYPLRLVGDATDYVKGTADYINKLKAIQATLPEGSSKWNSIQNKISTLTEQVTKTIGKGKKISLKFKKAKTKKLTGKASYGGIKLTGGKTRTASIRTQKRKGSPNIELWRK